MSEGEANRANDDTEPVNESTQLLSRDVTMESDGVDKQQYSDGVQSSASAEATFINADDGDVLRSRGSSLTPTVGHLHSFPGIRRSLSTNVKRHSTDGDVEVDDPSVAVVCSVVDGSRASLLSHRPPICRTLSYGTTYSPVRQKRSTLSRLSFAEVVERITLTWENIDVYAPTASSKPIILRGLGASTAKADSVQAKHILKDVSGVAAPNTLLAVIGASGAGKTTLLNVLTYRNRGNLLINGEVRVNGGRIGSGMTSLSAYIQQEDLFIGTLTVREHLWFQSQLKMDKDVPNDIRQQRVADVMQEMGLNKCGDVMIGIPGKIKGISGGEKKRLAFASEVLTNPSLLFLDEPTSGLDSYMAQNIVVTLKSMAAKGRTVICTIHQPSSEVFELFDRLMVMAEGRVAYLGAAKDAVPFFNQCGFPLPPNYNPADYFVHTLAVESSTEDQSREKIKRICDAYAVSKQAENVKAAISEANYRGDGTMYEEESFSELSPYKASYFRQLYVVMWRCFINNMREPEIFRSRLIQVTFMGLIFGLVYWRQPLNQLSISNINGALFLMLTQMTFGFAFNVVMTFPTEFPVFMREHLDGMYRTDVYFLCKTMADFPQFFVLPVVFTVIMYFCAGLYSTAEAFFICLAVNLLTCNISVSFGYLLSCATSNVGIALAVAPLFIVPFSTIGGFFINPVSIPDFLIWLKYLSWFTYGNEILVVNQWQHVTNISCSVSRVAESNIVGNTSTVMPRSIDDINPRCIASGMDVISMFGYEPSNVTFDFLILLLLLLAFRVIAYTLLAFRARRTYKISKKLQLTSQ